MLESLKAVTFSVILAFICWITWKYMLPMKEKRPLVLTFYIIATIFCLLTIAVSIWNAVKASNFIH